MKKKFIFPAILLLIASATIPSCSAGFGNGDQRDRNIEKAVFTYLDSIPEVEYVGTSDNGTVDGNYQAVIIYYAPDTAGVRTEHNARVTTTLDGSEILSWENLDGHILSDVKKKVSDKLEEKGITTNSDDIIDALIKLKKHYK